MPATILRTLGILALLATGCSLGDAGSTGDDDDTLEGGTDNEQLGIQCRAELTTSGSFVIGEAQPADVTGCWPIGVWTFTASVAENDCDDAPDLLPEYKFEVGYILDADGEREQTFEFLTDPDADFKLGVSSGGGGLCEGGLQILSDDGMEEWNFKPALYADGSLSGHGQYRLYDESQL